MAEATRAHLAYLLVWLMFAGLGVTVVIALMHRKKETDEKGQAKETKVRVRRRTVQFLAVSFIIPMVLILALSEILQPETLATLLGTLFGYVLSGIGEEKD